MTDPRPQRPAARRRSAFLRPVFVLGTPGAEAARVAGALAAATGACLLDGEGDLFVAAERLQPAHRGWDSARLGFQDAKRPVVEALEADWLARLRSADGAPVHPGAGVRLVATYPEAALHLPFLAAAWPDARFVVVRRDRAASIEEMTAAWASGDAVTHPDLPGWDGPPWSLALTPGWRELRGAELDELVAAQWAAADGVLATDLEDLPGSRWTAVDLEAFTAGPDQEVARLRQFAMAGPEPRPTEQRPSRYRSVSTTSFAELLDRLGASVLATTYQTGRLVVARALDGKLNTHFRSFESPMGLAYRGDQLSIGTKGQVWNFRNLPGVARDLSPEGRHDACFVPRSTLFTGDIRVHDVAWASGELWAVATRFSCLATFDGQHNFVPRWRPPFITALAAEDRCHLNGLAVVEDRVKFVTALGTSDSAGGWRATKADGGVIMDIESNEVVVAGLSMPHSPRWYRDRLWVLESGQGSLATVDLATGRVETVARLPGFTRGLAFAGRYAFVGLSEVREANTFGGLPLTARLEDRECGIWVVDIETGQTVAYLRFEEVVQEMFDVAVLPGIRFPELLEPGAEPVLNSFVLPRAAAVGA